MTTQATIVLQPPSLDKCLRALRESRAIPDAGALNPWLKSSAILPARLLAVKLRNASAEAAAATLRSLTHSWHEEPFPVCDAAPEFAALIADMLKDWSELQKQPGIDVIRKRVEMPDLLEGDQTPFPKFNSTPLSMSTADEVVARFAAEGQLRPFGPGEIEVLKQLPNANIVALVKGRATHYAAMVAADAQRRDAKTHAQHLAAQKALVAAFAGMSPAQRALELSRRPWKVAYMPRDEIRFEHLLAAFQAANVHALGFDQATRGTKSFNYAGILALRRAPVALHTSLMLKQAIVGCFDLSQYAPDWTLPYFTEVTALLRFHPLATEEFMLDLVELNPCLVRVLPDSLLNGRILEAAGARARQLGLDFDPMTVSHIADVFYRVGEDLGLFGDAPDGAMADEGHNQIHEWLEGPDESMEDERPRERMSA